MPTFDGNMLNWIDFWMPFEAEIHNDLTMTNVHKFSYLKALLKGSKFDFIRKMIINDVNYERAVTVL